MMIRLLHDRPAATNKPFERRVFLRRGVYPCYREIEGMGWMVYTNLDLKFPQMTIIRYKDGEEA